MIKDLQDINIYRECYKSEKEFKNAVDFCRQTLEDNFLRFKEFDYSDRYIFGELIIEDTTVINYENKERSVENV